MPDGEVLPVGGHVGRSSDKEMSDTDEETTSKSTRGAAFVGCRDFTTFSSAIDRTVARLKYF